MTEEQDNNKTNSELSLSELGKKIYKIVFDKETLDFIIMLILIYLVYLVLFKGPKKEDVFLIDLTPTDDVLDRLIFSPQFI